MISSNHQQYEEDIECITGQKNGRGAIFLGNLEAAQNLATLSKHNIKAVISVAKGGFLVHSQQQLPNYMYVPAIDSKEFDLSVHFAKTYDFIDKNRKKSNVLVHCMAGISRSATIVIAYLMRKSRIGLVEAYTLVKRMRPIIKPNQGFMTQLKRYQETFRNGGETTKENISNILVRNRSYDTVDRRQEQQHQQSKAIARMQDKIKAINLQEKINSLRQRFGSHQKRGSSGDVLKSKINKPSITFRAGLEQQMMVSPPDGSRQNRLTQQINCRATYND